MVITETVAVFVQLDFVETTAKLTLTSVLKQLQLFLRCAMKIIQLRATLMVVLGLETASASRVILEIIAKQQATALLLLIWVKTAPMDHFTALMVVQSVAQQELAHALRVTRVTVDPAAR
jgi:hypothetical protein